MPSITPIRRKAISPELADVLDAVNARPRLRELFEECADLGPQHIELLKTFAARLKQRGDTHG